MVNLLLIDGNFISLNWIKMIENKEKKLLFHHDEQKDSTTYIIFFDKWIEITWDWYDRWRLKNLSEIVTYCIMNEELNKLIKIIEKENLDLNSKIDTERCKNKIWEENWGKLDEREKRIYSVFDAVFYETDAYAVIFDYIKEKWIHYDFYWANTI